MSDLATHLVDRVLPEVPMRHWVCTVPWSLRARMGFDREACAALVHAFTGALSRLQRHRANEQLGLRSVSEAQTGAVTFIQRSDSALRLSPHLHVLGLDGVYLRGQGDGEPLRFEPLGAPSAEQLGWLVEATANEVLGALDLAEVDEPDPLGADEPPLAQCYGVAVQGRDAFGPRAGQPTVRLIEPSAISPRPSGPLAAEPEGFGVYADRGLDGRDRRRLFLLCRYLARPPLAQERLERLPGERLRLCYRLKRPWRDGTSAVVLHPWDLLARLCALVPPPRFHLVRASGVLASHASLRSQLVPGTERPESDSSFATVQMSLPLVDDSADAPACPPDTSVEPAPRRPSRTPWAKLIARVFQIDLTVCPDPACRGPMRIVGFATTPEEIAAHLSHMPRAPPRPGAVHPEPATHFHSQVDGRQLALRFSHGRQLGLLFFP